jgi:hypothetical protein
MRYAVLDNDRFIVHSPGAVEKIKDAKTPSAGVARLAGPVIGVSYGDASTPQSQYKVAGLNRSASAATPYE